MAKFKVLKYNQMLMSWQGIHSMNLTKPTNEFHRSLSSYYITFTLFAFVITSAVRIHGYWPEIEPILKPCSVAFGGVQCVGMFICIGFQMKLIKALHLELQRIIDEGIIGSRFGVKTFKLTQLQIFIFISNSTNPIN